MNSIMTPKARVIAQIQHHETDIVPYTLGYEEVVAERLDAYYGSKQWRSLLDDSIRGLPSPSEGILVNDTSGPYYTDLYGTTWRTQRPWHTHVPALKEPSLNNYKFPSADACFDADWEAKARKFISDYGDHFLVASFGFGLFERSWTMRGFEDAVADTALNPEFYDELVEQIAQHQMAIVERLIKLPVDGIMFSDDWGYQLGVIIGPKRWRKFLKPRLIRMYAQVRAAGKYVLTHCCGSIAEIISDLIEIGLDVLESIQPEAKGMNPYELKKQYGKNLTFWGGLGSQSIIPFGTPQEIHAEVVHLSHEMSRGGGYILEPAKALQPETPVENAATVVEAFLKQAGIHISSH